MALESFATLGGIVIAIAALLTAIIGYRRLKADNLKTRAEAHLANAEAREAEADREITLLPAYQAEVKSLREEVTRANKEVLQLRQHVDTLGAELRVQKRIVAEYKVTVDKLIQEMQLHDITPITRPPDYLG